MLSHNKNIGRLIPENWSWRPRRASGRMGRGEGRASRIPGRRGGSL